jgi:hypothetical protein
MLVLTIFHADQQREGREFDAASNIQQWFERSTNAV